MQLKSIKRFILVIVIFWIVLVIVGLVFSRSLQGKIIEKLTDVANNHLLAEVHLRKSNIHFSVFKKFPLASIEVKDIVVKMPPALDLQNVRPEHGDTLLFSKRLFLQLNLISLLRNEYELQKISAKDGFIQIITDKKGNSSLAIVKPGNAQKSFTTDIKSFSLSDFELITKSESSSFKSNIKVKQGEASGSFEKSRFSINLNSHGTIDKLQMQGEKFQPQQMYRMDVAITRNNNVFSIKKGLFHIGNIPMKMMGTINTSENTLIDLLFAANKVSLKQIDKSLLDGLIGRTGFDPQGGELSLQSTLKGYVKHSAPIVKADFIVQKGKLHHREKKILYTNVYLKGTANNSNNQGIKKSLSVNLDTFNLTSGSSNQYGEITINNIGSPEFSAHLKGVLSSKDIPKYVSSSNLTILNGKFENDIYIKGRLPSEKDEKLKIVSINGNMDLVGMLLRFEKLQIPTLNVNGHVIIENKHTLHFDSLFCQASNSIAVVNGSLHQFQVDGILPIISGKVHAYTLNVNDFVKKTEQKTNVVKALQFPESFKVNSKLTIDNLSIGKFSGTNLLGKVSYDSKTLQLDNVSMQALSGNLKGNIIIKQNQEAHLEMQVTANLSKNNLEEMFFVTNNFGQQIISSQHLNGLLSGNIQFSSTWTNTLKINNKSIVSRGDLLIENGELKNYQPIMGLSKFIEVEELEHIRFDNLNTSISIRNRKVTLNQTHIASSAITFDGSGIHDFDNKYDYRLQVGLSDILWKKARKKKKSINEFGYIVDAGSGRTTVPFIISGKGTNFDVKYDRNTSRTNFKVKVQQEKEVLKELFKSEPVTEAVEIKKEEKPKLEKTDSGTYRTTSEDFMLDWDDSEEVEDDSL